MEIGQITVSCFFFFKQKTAYEIMPSLVGSEMCIRDRVSTQSTWGLQHQSQLLSILNSMTITVYKKNQIIYKEYEKVKNIYFIRSGEVLLSQTINFSDKSNYVDQCKNEMNCDYLNVVKKNQNILSKSKRIGSIIIGPLNYFGEFEVIHQNDKRQYQAECFNAQSEIFSLAIDVIICLLYTSDAADDMQCVDLGGRRNLKKKKK
eukprot:TRINITY_DN3968_c0_g1_i1.p1 TRINITY_DN3968_c0_g1~~TRINITY_DN3968_c0_g1_i1.p1  ORF type:complete len:204 (-),score=41.51 TRINITY_DN3968_c0_g1_i1:88-699(-)